MTTSGSEHEPPPLPAPRWRELGPLGKLARLGAVVFFAAFLAQGVARPLPKEHWFKDYVSPIQKEIGFLRLSSTWRMFVGEARFGYIVLETETGAGERYQLEPFRWEGKSVWERNVDLRLRKMQAKLKSKSHRRRWGRHYLAYVCRSYASEIPDISTIEIIRKRPLILDDAGKRKSRPRSRVLAHYACESGRLREVRR